MQNQTNLMKEERQALLLATLQREGKVLASEWSERLRVSEDTIRRDLRELARQQKLQRVHGGALPRSTTVASYTERQRQAPAEKSAIGAAAAKLVAEGQLIFVDGGTTTLQLARHLPLELRATVVTNSPAAAVALANHSNVEIILLGGRFSKPAQVTIGAAAVEELRRFHADLCFLGVCSLHPEVGLSIGDFEEAQIKRAMIANSAEVAGLVLADKLGTALPYVVAPARALTYLITDASASDASLVCYREAGVTVIQAGT
ncbi:MAG TPA: DeoR/GlpR family DNA-binding transcription regulator [Bryobacteraceae bacterium]|nr:DeoR/GlpR family DNA-binding transcription regulator [Bryobacteraceae bacterium]